LAIELPTTGTMNDDDVDDDDDEIDEEAVYDKWGHLGV
jgi:hypothetical protein